MNKRVLSILFGTCLALCPGCQKEDDKTPDEKDPFSYDRGFAEGHAAGFRVGYEKGKMDALGAAKGLGGTTTRESPVDPREQALHDKLKRWIIPKMAFEDASLNDVIKFISTTSRELDEDKVGINILYMVTGDDDRPAPITVNLSQLSIMDALRFVTEISGVHYRLDRDVVIIEGEGPVANDGKAKPIGTNTEQKE